MRDQPSDSVSKNHRGKNKENVNIEQCQANSFKKELVYLETFYEFLYAVIIKLSIEMCTDVYSDAVSLIVSVDTEHLHEAQQGAGLFYSKIYTYKSEAPILYVAWKRENQNILISIFQSSPCLS